jgi:hypothetical protein
VSAMAFSYFIIGVQIFEFVISWTLINSGSLAKCLRGRSTSKLSSTFIVSLVCKDGSPSLQIEIDSTIKPVAIPLRIRSRSSFLRNFSVSSDCLRQLLHRTINSSPRQSDGDFAATS